MTKTKLDGLVYIRSTIWNGIGGVSFGGFDWILYVISICDQSMSLISSALKFGSLSLSICIVLYWILSAFVGKTADLYPMINIVLFFFGNHHDQHRMSGNWGHCRALPSAASCRAHPDLSFRQLMV